MDPEERYRALAAHLKDDPEGLELASQLWEAGGSWEEGPFLLTAGAHYYPVGGTGDWKGTFASREAANKMAVSLKRAHWVDWFYVVDLRKWAFPKEGEYCCGLKKESLTPLSKLKCLLCGSITQA